MSTLWATVCCSYCFAPLLPVPHSLSLLWMCMLVSPIRDTCFDWQFLKLPKSGWVVLLVAGGPVRSPSLITTFFIILIAGHRNTHFVECSTCKFETKILWERQPIFLSSLKTAYKSVIETYYVIIECSLRSLRCTTTLRSCAFYVHSCTDAIY